MFKSIRYVLNENFSNLYRIFCIGKYELLADMRDSKFEYSELCIPGNSGVYILVDFRCRMEEENQLVILSIFHGWS